MVSPAIRAEVIWDSDGTLWAMNVLHLRPQAVGVPDQSTADAIATVLADAYQTPVAPAVDSLEDHIASTVRLHSVRVSDLRVVNPTIFQSNILLAGTGSNIQLPDNISLAVEFAVGQGARNGRVFQWGYTTTANAVQGRPTAAAIDATINMWDQVRNDISGVTGIEALAVLSRVSNTTSDVQIVRRSPTMIAAGWSQQKRRRDGLQLIV